MNATDIWNKDLCSYGGRISFKKSLKTAIPNARVTFYAGRSSNNGFEFRANFDDGRGIHWTFMSPTNNRHGVDFSLSRQVPMSCGLLFYGGYENIFVICSILARTTPTRKDMYRKRCTDGTCRLSIPPPYAGVVRNNLQPQWRDLMFGKDHEYVLDQPRTLKWTFDGLSG